MSEFLYIDLESRSELNLLKVGSYVYWEHPSTEVLCAAWALDDEEVQMWLPGEPCPPAIFDHVTAGGMVSGWNVGGFERIAWRACLGPVHGWPVPLLEQYDDTAAMAAAMALPRALEDIGPALNLTIKKDAAGRKIMLEMCKPRRFHKGDEPGVAYWYDDEIRHRQLRAYCKRDVEVERAVRKRLIPLSESERRIWLLDMVINDRGVQIDLDLVRQMEKIVKQEKKRLDRDMARITDGVITATSQVQALTAWLREQGAPVDSLDKRGLDAILRDPSLPSSCVDAIVVRREAAKASTAKLQSAQVCSCSDGRARGLMLYHGASTGRWCLAEGSMVLTRTGEKPIETVTTADEVWDGEEWVRHDGVVYNGYKMVIKHDGIIATPEHIVYLGPDHKISLGDAKERKRSLWRGITEVPQSSLKRPNRLDKRRTRTYDILNAGPHNRFMANGRIVSNSGKLLQPHNFVRGSGDKLVPCLMQGDAALLDMLHGNPLAMLAKSMRAIICAPKGKRYVAADFSQIEARVTAWIAGQTDVIEAFEKYDRGEGPGIYEVSAAGIYGCPVEEVTEDDPRRQTGKTATLACGFGGGVTALANMAANYGIDMSMALPALLTTADERTRERIAKRYEDCLARSDSSADVLSKAAWLACELTKIGWRAANPRTVESWTALDDAAIAAVEQTGKVIRAVRKDADGYVVGTLPVSFKVAYGYLWMLLPSGRCLAYPAPYCAFVEVPWADRTLPREKREKRWAVTVLGVGGNNQFMRYPLYPGLTVQHAVQATARDLMAAGMLRAEDHGYPIVLTVHDEVLAEMFDGEGDLEEFRKLLCVPMQWTHGLPIAASGWEGPRFRK